MRKPLKIALVGVGLAVALTGCSIPNTQSDEIYVHKGGGLFEGHTSKECIQPSTRKVQSFGDDYYAYPANQRVYDFTTGEHHDGDPISVVSKDGQTLTIPGTLSFNLNTNCGVLSAFHDNIGNRYKAYMEDDQTTAGWERVLAIYMRPELDATLDRIAKQYTWQQLYSDPAIKSEINTEVNTKIKTLINQQLEGDKEYFTGFSALIQQPLAPKQLVDAVQLTETSKANALATKAKAEADASAAQAAATAQVAQKTAELKVARIEAEIKAAEIASYGGAQRYIDFLAIQKGLNPYQPTYGGSPLITTPGK